MDPSSLMASIGRNETSVCRSRLVTSLLDGLSSATKRRRLTCQCAGTSPSQATPLSLYSAYLGRLMVPLRHSRAGGNPVPWALPLRLALDSRLRGNDEQEVVLPLRLVLDSRLRGNDEQGVARDE